MMLRGMDRSAVTEQTGVSASYLRRVPAARRLSPTYP